MRLAVLTLSAAVLFNASSTSAYGQHLRTPKVRHSLSSYCCFRKYIVVKLLGSSDAGDDSWSLLGVNVCMYVQLGAIMMDNIPVSTAVACVRTYIPTYLHTYHPSFTISNIITG